jgi:hypothetical protein
MSFHFSTCRLALAILGGWVTPACQLAAGEKQVHIQQLYLVEHKPRISLRQEIHDVAK